MEIPLKPFPMGKISHVFGGESKSAEDVLIRARTAISPRKAWAKGSWTKTNVDGSISRCTLQLINDVDGKHAEQAKRYVKQAIKELHPDKADWPIDRWNDHASTEKHHVIAVLDRAIEISRTSVK